MAHRVGMAGVLALLCLCAPGARGSDLPFTGNLVAQEVRDIERGVSAVPVTSTAHAHVKSVIGYKVRWRAGLLKACFWNGDTAMRERVATIADELVAQLPVKFQWRENGTISECGDVAQANAPWLNYDVRVSLKRAQNLLKPGDNAREFFALVGRQDQTGRLATVNLPFRPGQSESDIRNLTLHEFCHVLGCLHEHQRALCAKDFDEKAIQAAFQLTPEAYRQDFLAIPSSHAFGPVSLGGFDQQSVMLYRLTRDMFVKGSNSPCIVDTPASKLSDLDKAGLRNAYTGTTDGLKLEDFARLAGKARLRADVQRSFAAYLRDNLKALGGESGSQEMVFQARVREAESLASDAEAEADSYILTPEQTAAIRRALSYFPAD